MQSPSAGLQAAISDPPCRTCQILLGQTRVKPASEIMLQPAPPFARHLRAHTCIRVWVIAWAFAHAHTTAYAHADAHVCTTCSSRTHHTQPTPAQGHHVWANCVYPSHGCHPHVCSARDPSLLPCAHLGPSMHAWCGMPRACAMQLVRPADAAAAGAAITGQGACRLRS